MKKLIFTLGFTYNVFISFGQWTFEKIENGFDDPYRIAYTSVNNQAVLKLENESNYVVFYIKGGYYCEDYPIVDLVFVINGENYRYSIDGIKNKKGDAIFLSGDLASDVFFESFKKCSSIKVRVNETNCSSETYTFNMSKSTSAYNFMTKIDD
jgi:hypothetical protein